jgi:hypothetical protein
MLHRVAIRMFKESSTNFVSASNHVEAMLAQDSVGLELSEAETRRVQLIHLDKISICVFSNATFYQMHEKFGSLLAV